MFGKIRNDYLSKENANCVKFVFAIAIVFCHIFAYEPFGKGIGIGAIITALGYLSVSVFLFFSGYGLTVLYKNKGDDCFNGYLRKRVLPIYIIQAILIMAYALFKYAIGYKISPKLLVQSFLFGDTVVQYGWYLQMIMLFYVVYWLCYRKATLKTGIIRLSLSVLVFCIICTILKMPSNWYESSFSFVFGAVWACKKEIIDAQMNVLRKYILAVICVFVVFAGTFVLGNSGILPVCFKMPFKMISAVSFIGCVLLAVMKIQVKFRPIEFAGKYYFEIYIIQGFVILLLNEVLSINNMLIRYFACFIATILLAIMVKPMVNVINTKCKGE